MPLFFVFPQKGDDQRNSLNVWSCASAVPRPSRSSLIGVTEPEGLRSGGSAGGDHGHLEVMVRKWCFWPKNHQKPTSRRLNRCEYSEYIYIYFFFHDV